MSGEKVSYTPCELDRIIREKNMEWFCSDPELDLSKYISDPVLLKNQQFYQKRTGGMTPELCREYIRFAFEHKDRLDPLSIAFHCLRSGRQQKAFEFKNLTPEAEKLITSRKLWDFMEDIPADQDPRTVTAAVVEELVSKIS